MRFFDLNWDMGQYLHPDERLYINASNLALPKSFSEFLSTSSPLNPHMFYYGSFPLYLYKITTVFILPHIDLLIVSRILSALFSSLTILLIFGVSRQLFSSRAALLSALIFAFTPGSIQYAHFNTTESLLIFLLTLTLYLTLRLYQEHKAKDAMLLGVAIGLSFATKIIGLSYLLLPGTALFLIFIKSKHDKIQATKLAFIICFLALLVGTILTPYQLIDWNNFIKEQSYMQNVTYGKYKPPFVIIYEHTLPYLYPLLNSLPFTYGFMALATSVSGLFLLFKQTKLNAYKSSAYLIILVFPLLYFTWSGMWFAKFSRYYLLLLPFLVLYTTFVLEKLRHQVRFIILGLIILQGLLFFRIYFSTHTRIAASEWIYNNLPKEASIASEHWDDSLPLTLNYGANKYTLLSLPVYDADNTAKITALADTLSQSDYLTISSRRVYASILNNSKIYPYTSNYYYQLFAGKLGFYIIKSFYNYPYFFSDDFADESFQSYDHPPVLIFKNQKKFTANKITDLILSKQ